MISSIPDSCLQSWFPRAEFHLASLSPFPPVPPLQIGCRFLVSWQPTSPSPLSIPLHHPLILPSPSPLAPTPPLSFLVSLSCCTAGEIKSRQKVRPLFLLDALRPPKIQAFVSWRCRSYPISCGNLPRNSGQESCRAAFRVVLGDFVLFFCSFRVRLVLSELCDEYPSTLLGDDTGFWVNLRRISVEKKPLLFSETRLKTKEFFGPVVLSLTYSRLFLHHVFYQGDKTFFESSG